MRNRASYLNRKYGMSQEAYGDLLASQGGVCAICGHFPEEEENLHVDHHHGSGATRGLLCWRCNMGIGLFREDPEHLEKAIEYLRKYNYNKSYK